MMNFLYHESLQNEIDSLEKRFKSIRDAFASFERLCQAQFNSINPRQVIAPSKLHRVTQNDIWTMWKVELVIPNSGLRPNQYPRMWFAVRGEIVTFLCISTHIDNYDNTEMEKLALARITDIF